MTKGAMCTADRDNRTILGKSVPNAMELLGAYFLGSSPD